MKPKLTLIYILLAFSIILSIVAIGLTLLRIEPYRVSEETYIGILVSLLGIIFAIFITYQIYNVVDIKNDIKSFSETKKDLENSISVLKEELNSQIASSYFNRAVTAISLNKYSDAINFLLKSLYSYLNLDSFYLYGESIDNIRNNILYCVENDFTKEDFEKEIKQIKESPKYNILSNDLKNLLEKVSKNSS